MTTMSEELPTPRIEIRERINQVPHSMLYDVWLVGNQETSALSMDFGTSWEEAAHAAGQWWRITGWAVYDRGRLMEEYPRGSLIPETIQLYEHADGNERVPRLLGKIVNGLGLVTGQTVRRAKRGVHAWKMLTRSCYDGPPSGEGMTMTDFHNRQRRRDDGDQGTEE